MSFNVKYIFPGDDKNQILSKVNYNFAQILFNAIGEKGPIGEIGPTGIIGEVGTDGEIGATGNRASNWFFSIAEPPIADSQKNDIWINVGPTGAQKVYVFDGTTWDYTGETILGNSTFGLLTEIQGPGGSTTHNAIDISNPTPSNVTFVFSDSAGTTSNINPNLAKFLVATDASTSNFPILGFDKTFVGSSTIPSFSWESIGQGYELGFSTPGNLVLSSGLTAAFSATGGTATLLSSGLLSIQSNASVSFENATGASASASFSTPNIITFSASNKQLTASGLSYLNLTSGAGITASSSELVQVYSAGNGMLLETTGSAGASGAALATFVNSSGYTILESRSNNFNVVGQSGPSGSASGRFVRAAQALTNVSASSTFTRSGFTNNYVPVSLTSSSSGIIYVVPKYVSASSIYSDGKQYRLYLQLTGFTNTWDAISQEGRIFDIFLEDDTLCFGGIRTVYPGGASTVQIGDISTSATGGCRHIRITTVSNETAFYYALTPKLSSPSRCGYIALTSTVSGTPGGGPTSGA
jgi:hypothetical protein